MSGMVFVPEGQANRSQARSACMYLAASEFSSRRDGAIVAWHEVPGTAPPQQNRPVGYGMIGCS
jgi:hypothetical protein